MTRPKKIDAVQVTRDFMADRQEKAGDVALAQRIRLGAWDDSETFHNYLAAIKFAFHWRTVVGTTQRTD